MAGPDYDFAICGSTPFASLLAGLLASAHGKRVCLVGDAWSPYRLSRRIDMSVSAVTRPGTWALLRREAPEVLRLLNGLGRGAFERVDPLFVAETPAGIERLGHMRWTASAHGFAAERAADPSVTAAGTICRIRDAAMLVPSRAEPAIDSWLAKTGVTRFSPAAATIGTKRDGTATLGFAGATHDVAMLVLAGDDAILTHQPAADRHRLTATTACTAIQTEPAGKGLPAALCHYLDRDLVLYQRAGKGVVSALAAGDADTALARLGASLTALGPLRRTGRALFRRIETVDGAPLIGRTGRHKVMVVAGLGYHGVFVAPAVARVLAGSADGGERDYFDAHDVSKAGHRQAVAEREPAAAEDAA